MYQPPVTGPTLVIIRKLFGQERKKSVARSLQEGAMTFLSAADIGHQATGLVIQ